MKHLLVLLLLQLLTISLPSIAGEATQLVYDTEGHALRSDSVYYILLADQKTGLRNYYRGDDMYDRCIFFVGQGQVEDYMSFPVQITPSSGGTVGLSSYITITFYIFNACIESLDWYLTSQSPVSSSEQHQYVATGKRRESDPSVPPSVFRIERYGDATKGYKLVWCAEEGPCKDLGIYTSKETNWLVASDPPLAVVFKKAQV